MVGVTAGTVSNDFCQYMRAALFGKIQGLQNENRCTFTDNKTITLRRNSVPAGPVSYSTHSGRRRPLVQFHGLFGLLQRRSRLTEIVQS